ncbi:MAG: hypothetical protein ACI8Z9_000133 [Paraglaciecola sp.]|jgi:hypothetical protein
MIRLFEQSRTPGYLSILEWGEVKGVLLGDDYTDDDPLEAVFRATEGGIFTR